MSGDATTMAVSVGDGPVEGADGADLQTVLDALSDPECRRILRAVDASALTANECSAACDLPLSTTYRKLELLSAAGLLEERLRLRRDGKHASQYRRAVEAVRFQVTDDGAFAVELGRRDAGAAPPAPADD